MMKKQISKISLLSAMLVATMVNAQEFYTCVPKRNWWSDLIKDGVEKGVTEGKKEIEENKWETIIDLTTDSNPVELKQALLPGKYRVTVAVAGVGMDGEKKVRIFTLDKKEEFKACIEVSGGNGGDKYSIGKATYIGGGGGGGGGSYFEIGEVKLLLKGGDGEDATQEKAGKGASPDGYIKIEKWK